MSTGHVNSRDKKYLHLHHTDKHKCSHSFASFSSLSAASSESSRSRQHRSDREVYGSVHHNYNSKSSWQHRPGHSRSDSESPPARHYSRRTSRDRQRMRQARDHPQASRCIGVFGLSTNTTQQKVRELFNKFGYIERIQMVIDAHTHRSRGFCFIYFENLGDARVAKDSCTGMEVDGRRIRVDYSITQRAHTPTPGVYMGRPSRQGRRSREREYSMRARRRQRDESSSLSPYEFSRRKYRSRQRSERSRSRTRSYSRLRSPNKNVRMPSRY